MASMRFYKPLAAVAVVFGALTLFSGGQALFGDAEARAAVGQAVGFVLWFNFLAGFVYLLAGLGLWLRQPWARSLAWALVIGTSLVAAAFGLHAWNGGGFEARTVGALVLRLGFWVAVVALTGRPEHRG
ncbi:hypothetical protein LPB72_15840 [Hydrogenophaga crassostreae]|uniref:DUF4345 domain-containing protein n=1 Tax=Hydrogenophaga crassostreae TaxID=1763535 RepID=A0A167H6M9_9BURK|nr:hypothetical protein [Hydrogenophaga crassostreae]AOW12523.1 hypothetical protein LPB072_06355 [Hydrogenophaga crassostreae]OAD40391.1 hypothetical protein LPB72_15840 [Hydrogenophaga crassostreae]